MLYLFYHLVFSVLGFIAKAGYDLLNMLDNLMAFNIDTFCQVFDNELMFLLVLGKCIFLFFYYFELII